MTKKENKKVKTEMKLEDTTTKMNAITDFAQEVMAEELNEMTQNIHKAQVMTKEISDNYRGIKDVNEMYQVNMDTMKTIFETAASNFAAQNTKLTERTQKFMNIFA